MVANLDMTNMAPMEGAQLGSGEKSKVATSGPNLVRVEQFEQFKGKYWLSTLTNVLVDHPHLVRSYIKCHFSPLGSLYRLYSGIRIPITLGSALPH